MILSLFRQSFVVVRTVLGTTFQNSGEACSLSAKARSRRICHGNHTFTHRKLESIKPCRFNVDYDLLCQFAMTTYWYVSAHVDFCLAVCWTTNGGASMRADGQDLMSKEVSSRSSARSSVQCMLSQYLISTSWSRLATSSTGQELSDTSLTALPLLSTSTIGCTCCIPPITGNLC